MLLESVGPGAHYYAPDLASYAMLRSASQDQQPLESADPFRFDLRHHANRAGARLRPRQTPKPNRTE